MSSLLEIEDLRVDFATRHGPVTALDRVSLDVREGETLGIVGESGCGKSITALSIMGLIPMPPGRIVGGSIRIAGEELIGASRRRLRALRGSEIAMIFQEPMTSLNPVFTAGEQIAEAIMLHQNLGRDAALRAAVELLDRVGIPDPGRRAQSYPHQLSGGMRQRVMIAMAVSCRPRLLIADEPTTALDVTVQAQIFDLLNDIQRDFGTAVVLITHDMGAIAEMADRVAVMYAGRVIEQGAADAILDDPLHPYAEGLIACIPALGKSEETDERPPPLAEIPGVVPPLHLIGAGCAFAERCPRRFARCDAEKPALTGDPSHPAACFAVEEGRA
ncbi:MAG: ABC transporter ATP-binding protein [Pseudomonadota bacterium]